jgi:hypothetical protein
MPTLNPSDLILAKVKSHVPGWSVPIDATYEQHGPYAGFMVTLHHPSGSVPKFHICEESAEGKWTLTDEFISSKLQEIGFSIALNYTDHGCKSMGEVVGIPPANHEEMNRFHFTFRIVPEWKNVLWE